MPTATMSIELATQIHQLFGDCTALFECETPAELVENFNEMVAEHEGGDPVDVAYWLDIQLGIEDAFGTPSEMIAEVKDRLKAAGFFGEVIDVAALKPDPVDHYALALERFKSSKTIAPFLTESTTGYDNGRVISFCLKQERHARGRIGNTIRVKDGPNASVRGVIVEAEVSGIRNRGRSIVAQFRVVLESGDAKVRREFFIEQL